MSLIGGLLGIGGSLLGGLFGSKSSGDASDAMAGASREQTALQREMFQKQNKLQKRLFKGQKQDVGAAHRQGRRASATELKRNQKAARELAKTTERRVNRTARENLSTIRGTADENLGTIRGTARENIDGIRGTRRLNIGELEDARGKSLQGFRPYADAGGNALLAYAHNLGLGKGPKGYGGLDLTPGAEFLMTEGRKEVEGGAAGAGGLYSGETMEELERMRQGIAATDRDNQMAQLFSMLGMGQSATGSMADIRSRYADAITGERTDATRGIGDERTWRAGEVGDERRWRAGGVVGARDDRLAGLDLMDTRLHDSLTGNRTNFTDRSLNLGQNFVGNMGAARSNRANLFGSAAQGYAAGGSNALANLGNARGAGAIGQGIAWGNALEGMAGAAAELPWGQWFPQMNRAV